LINRIQGKINAAWQQPCNDKKYQFEFDFPCFLPQEIEN
jgi:hypothetical protein